MHYAATAANRVGVIETYNQQKLSCVRFGRARRNDNNNDNNNYSTGDLENTQYSNPNTHARKTKKKQNIDVIGMRCRCTVFAICW